MEQIKHLNTEYLIFKLNLKYNLHALIHKNLNNTAKEKKTENNNRNQSAKEKLDSTFYTIKNCYNCLILSNKLTLNNQLGSSEFLEVLNYLVGKPDKVYKKQLSNAEIILQSLNEG